MQPDSGVAAGDMLESGLGMGDALTRSTGPQRDHRQSGAGPRAQCVVVDDLSVGEGGAGLFGCRVRVPEIVGGCGHQPGQLSGDEVEVGDLRGTAGAFEHAIRQVPGTPQLSEHDGRWRGRVGVRETGHLDVQLLQGRVVDREAGVGGVLAGVMGCGHDRVRLRVEDVVIRRDRRGGRRHSVCGTAGIDDRRQ